MLRAQRPSLMLTCALCACTPGEPVDAGSTSEAETTGTETAGTETAGTETAGTETAGTETGDEMLGSTVSGRVVDELGEPVAALSITLCGEICQIGMTDAAGNFEVTDVSPGPKVLEPALVPIEDDDLMSSVLGWSRFFDIVSVVEGEDLELAAPFVMLRVEGTLGPLTGPQMLEFELGLSVSFDADFVLEAGALPVGVDAVHLGARAIPQQLWPSGGLGDWTIIAAWTLAPWDLDGEDAYAVTAALPEPLSPDAEVAFLVADYTYGFINGLFFEEAAVLAPDGASLSTPPDGGLDRATAWLAVTR